MSDYKLTIDGAEKEISENYLLVPGEHIVRVEKSNYKTIIDTINVSLDKTLFQYTLKQARPVKLTIKSKSNNSLCLFG